MQRANLEICCSYLIQGKAGPNAAAAESERSRNLLSISRFLTDPAPTLRVRVGPPHATRTLTSVGRWAASICEPKPPPWNAPSAEEHAIVLDAVADLVADAVWSEVEQEMQREAAASPATTVTQEGRTP
jgi:hypothetical protein